MKKIILLYTLFTMAGQLCSGQTKYLENDKEIYKILAAKKAANLQIELSLNDEQTERVAAKILKYSLTAENILQSDLEIEDKTKELYKIAAEQKEEIRLILSESQYTYYKRRSSPTSIHR